MNVGSREMFDENCQPYDVRLAYFTTSKSVGQYFKTGLDGSLGSRYVGKMMLRSGTPYSTSYGFGIYGNVSTSPSTTRHGLGFGGGHTWQICWGGGGAAPASTAGYEYIETGSYLNKVIDVDYICKSRKQKLVVDGVTIRDYSYAPPYYAYQSGYQLSLLSWYVNGAEQARPTWMDFYGCKLYTYDANGNETLARDYVTCIKDGIVCLYDEVSKTFFYNAGQGELIPGERT